MQKPPVLSTIKTSADLWAIWLAFLFPLLFPPLLSFCFFLFQCAKEDDSVHHGLQSWKHFSLSSLITVACSTAFPISFENQTWYASHDF